MDSKQFDGILRSIKLFSLDSYFDVSIKLECQPGLKQDLTVRGRKQACLFHLPLKAEEPPAQCSFCHRLHTRFSTTF